MIVVYDLIVHKMHEQKVKKRNTATCVLSTLAYFALKDELKVEDELDKLYAMDIVILDVDGLVVEIG